MFSRVNLHHIFTFAFYLILIGISVNAFITLIQEQTAFEETIAENQAIVPSFTLCPQEHHDSIVGSIKNFDDVTKAIENSRFKYIITINNSKAFEEVKTTIETFNDTSNDVWYFAPKTSIDHPFDTVICLIWTPSLRHEFEQDYSVTVCKKIYFNSDHTNIAF